MKFAARYLAVVVVLIFIFVGCRGTPLSRRNDAGGDAAVDSSIDQRPGDGAADLPADGSTFDAAGDSDDDAGPTPDGGVCSTPSLGAAPLQMLTVADYRRVVHDLGVVTPLSTQFPPDATESGFESRAALQVATPLLASLWQQAAEEVAAAMLSQLPQTLGCDPATVGEGACVAQFVRAFGQRAYRRPLTTDESKRLIDLYSAFRPYLTLPSSVGVIIRAVLQSPQFLYRVELGQPPAVGDRLPLSPYEVASRLSFLAWRSGPDQQLFAAAAASSLSTPQQREAQLRRMLADPPHAREGVRDFFRQWLQIDRIGSAPKDTTLFPQLTPALRAAMQEEPYRLIDQVIFEGDGRIGTLLAGRQGIVNADLAQLYGLTPPLGPNWAVVSLASVPRQGLLTQGWFLATQASATETLPVERGVFVRSRLLCLEVPPAPPNLSPVPPPDPTKTTRERYMAALSDPVCASCHGLIDDAGFSFEHYDAIGRFRAVENGKPIDTAGSLRSLPGANPELSFADAPDLLTQLAASPLVRDCVVRRWYETTQGRRVEAVDECELARLNASAAASGGDLRELLAALARSEALAYRPADGVILPPPGPAPGSPPAGLADERAIRKAVLDLVSAELSDLQRRLADPPDRMRLDQHLDAVRELERMLQ